MKNENLKEITSEEFWTIYGEMLEKGVNMVFVMGPGNMNFKVIQKDGFEYRHPIPVAGFNLTEFITLKLTPGMKLTKVYADTANDCFILEGLVGDALEPIDKDGNIDGLSKFTANCTFLSRPSVSSLLH